MGVCFYCGSHWKVDEDYVIVKMRVVKRTVPRAIGERWVNDA